MPIWEDYNKQATATVAVLATARSWQTILVNDSDAAEVFLSGDIVFIDGIFTVHTNGDDLWEVMFVIARSDETTTTLNAMARYNMNVWYYFHVARGPLPFRARSKKTLPVGHTLFMSTRKVQSVADASETIMIGINLMEVFVHGYR